MDWSEKKNRKLEEWVKSDKVTEELYGEMIPNNKNDQWRRIERKNEEFKLNVKLNNKWWMMYLIQS